MEVFLRGLPPDISQEILQAELTNLLGSPTKNRWNCTKSKQKNLAWIQFEDITDAKHFLGLYGVVRSPQQQPLSNVTNTPRRFTGPSQQKPRLSILNTKVYAQESNRKIEALGPPLARLRATDDKQTPR